MQTSVCMHLYFSHLVIQSTSIALQNGNTREDAILTRTNALFPCSNAVLTRFLYLNFLTRYNNMSRRSSCWTTGKAATETRTDVLHLPEVGFRYSSRFVIEFGVKYKMLVDLYKAFRGASCIAYERIYVDLNETSANFNILLCFL